MRNHSAEDTGNISGHEGDHELSGLAVLTLWLRENIRVEVLDNLLESDKLDNCVWNLSSPKWLETLKETCISFSGSDLVESCHSISWESSFSSGLHSYLGLLT